MTHQEFKERFLPLGDGLYRIAFRYLEDEADASDAVQDLYIKLWNSREKLDFVSSPQAYSYTLMRNLCIDRLRRRGKMAPEAQIPDRADSAPPDTEVAEREALRTALRCIKDLPERQRQILQMRVFEDLDYDEIAVRLGMSEINARVQLSLARKTLRTKMREVL